MGSAIGQTLGNAVGVAISPIPMIALTLMLFSRSASRNSLSFLAGWLVGLTAVGLVVIAIGFGSSSGETDSGGVLKIVIGLGLLALAWKQWSSRPRDGAPTEMPGWMAAIDDLTGVKAFGMGLLLTVPNPKNVGLTIAAAATISAAGLERGEEVATLAVFVFVASITIIVPVIGYLLASERITPALDATKEWLTSNSNTVMAVLFVVLGAKLLGDGIAVVA